jgi:hypothetical protein
VGNLPAFLSHTAVVSLIVQQGMFVKHDAGVDDFVAVEAPKLNRDQQAARLWLQRLQHQSLAIYKIQ